MPPCFVILSSTVIQEFILWVGWPLNFTKWCNPCSWGEWGACCKCSHWCSWVEALETQAIGAPNQFRIFYFASLLPVVLSSYYHFVSEKSNAVFLKLFAFQSIIALLLLNLDAWTLLGKNWYTNVHFWNLFWCHNPPLCKINNLLIKLRLTLVGLIC